MKYSPTIKYLLDLGTRASKSVLRDYNELVHMQNSFRSPEEFVSKSRIRSENLIIEEINIQKKYTPNIQVDGKFQDFNSRYTVIINPLDGLKNFQHAIPLFSIAISLKDEQSGDIIASVIELPAMREIYFAEKNNSAWHDSFLSSTASGSRLRMSKRSDFKTMYFATDHYIKGLEKQTLILNSPLLSLSLLVFGRFDACIFNAVNLDEYQLASLIITESGGIISKYGNNTIFANSDTKDQIEKFLEGK